MIYELNDEYHVRPLQAGDLDGPYPGWFEDQEVCRYNSHGKLFRTRAHFAAYLASLDAGDKVVWAICHRTDGHVGNVSLQGISWIDRHAEFAVIIGDRRHWGRGVAKMAARKLIDHAFAKLDLVRIHCGTAATNVAMRKLALALGMAEEGCRREHLFLDGRRVDVIEFGLLRSDARPDGAVTRP